MSPPLGPELGPRPASRALRCAALALVLLATAVVVVRTHEIGLMGFDSYPLILSSRITNFGDLLGTFTEELADGLYGGDYYRPLLNLSFALDYGLYGLESWGYQLTNALLFGATGLALWALALRLYGERSAGLGALLALAFFLLHESHFEVVPVPARRPELLCALFACLSLRAQLAPRELARRWPLRPALWMLAAALSKETGYGLSLVSVFAVYAYSPAVSWRERGGQAMRAGACHAATIGGLLALRLWVLGGLGGPDPERRTEGLGVLDRTATLFMRLLVSENHSQRAQWVGWIAALAGLGLLALCIVALRSRRSRAEGAAQAGALRALLVALLWTLLVGTLHGLSRMIQLWYLFLPLVGSSLLLGAGVELLRGLWTRSPALGRVGLGACAALLAAFAFFQVRYTPLLHDYPEWGRATRASDEFRAELARRIERTPSGQPLDAPPLPRWLTPSSEGPAIRGAAVLEVYSVQAWAELTFPERELQVLSSPPAIDPGPGVSVIRILGLDNL
jgi:hypothetical protein